MRGTSVRQIHTGHKKDFLKTKGSVMIRELRTIDATGISEEEREEAWKRIILFDKLVTNTSGDRSESLNGKLRRRLQAAEDGDWLALASELVDGAGSEKRKPGGSKTQKETEKAPANRVRACAAEGSWRSGIAAIKNAESKPRSAPKDWACILEELPEKDNIQEPMKNQRPISLDTEEIVGLREANKKKDQGRRRDSLPGMLGERPRPLEATSERGKGGGGHAEHLCQSCNGRGPDQYQRDVNDRPPYSPGQGREKSSTDHHPELRAKGKLISNRRMPESGGDGAYRPNTDGNGDPGWLRPGVRPPESMGGSRPNEVNPLNRRRGSALKDQQKTNCWRDYGEMEQPFQPVVWDPREESLVLQFRLSSTRKESTKYVDSVGETGQLKNTMGPSRRFIRRYFKPTNRRAKGGWGGGCFCRWARQLTPRADFLQQGRITERCNNWRDLPDRDEEGWAGPREPSGGAPFSA